MKQLLNISIIMLFTMLISSCNKNNTVQPQQQRIVQTQNNCSMYGACKEGIYTFDPIIANQDTTITNATVYLGFVGYGPALSSYNETLRYRISSSNFNLNLIDTTYANNKFTYSSTVNQNNYVISFRTKTNKQIHLRFISA